MSINLINKVIHCLINLCISGAYSTNDNQNVVYNTNVLYFSKAVNELPFCDRHPNLLPETMLDIVGRTINKDKKFT